MFQYIWNLI